MIMKKWTVVYISITAILCLLVVFNGYSQEDVIKVDDTGFTRKMRPDTPFLHDSHNEKAGLEDCQSCHHKYDEKKVLIEDESSEDQQCSECHMPEGTSNPVPLARVYHLRCKGCHEKEKKGPVMCAECHIENE